MPFPPTAIVWGPAALDQVEWEVVRPGTCWVAEEARIRQVVELAVSRPGLPGVGAHTHSCCSQQVDGLGGALEAGGRVEQDVG